MQGADGCFLQNELGSNYNVFERARTCRVSQIEVCTESDVVVILRDPALVGEVWFFASGDQQSFALVSTWATESRNDVQGTITVRTSDDAVALYRAEDILGSCTFRKKADGTAVVIAPWRFRHLF